MFFFYFLIYQRWRKMFWVGANKAHLALGEGAAALNALPLWIRQAF